MKKFFDDKEVIDLVFKENGFGTDYGSSAYGPERRANLRDPNKMKIVELQQVIQKLQKLLQLEKKGLIHKSDNPDAEGLQAASNERIKKLKEDIRMYQKALRLKNR